MKFISTLSIVTLLACIPAASQACDMHGGGGFNQLSYSNWKPYNYDDYKSDPEDSAQEDIDQASDMTDATSDLETEMAALPVLKPTFSMASMRAAGAAQARIAAKADASKASPDEATQDNTSED